MHALVLIQPSQHVVELDGSGAHTAAELALDSRDPLLHSFCDSL